MTSPLSVEEIQRVAELGRLKLSSEEVSEYTGQLGAILEYVAKLQDIDTEDVEPMAHAVEVQNVFREDEPRESLPCDAALVNAPKTDGEFFLVPQILGGGGA